jgi:hypothetical protein
MTRKISMPFDDHGVEVQNALFPSSTEVVLVRVAANCSVTPMVGQVVRLVATSNCYIKFGNVVAVATSSDVFLPANLPEYFSLRLDQYISVIRDTADGKLYITIME